MVAVKGLSTFKSRVSGDRDTRKSGKDGFRSLKVYTEDTKIKIMGRDPVPTETKKSVTVKAEFSHIHGNCQKEALNKLDKINRKSINPNQAKVGRNVLADISNSCGVFKKNATVDDSKPQKGKVERKIYSQRASVASGKDLEVFNGNSKIKGQETVVTRASVSSGKDLKFFNGNSKTKGKETAGYVTRRSLPVSKHVDNEEKTDIKRGSKDNKLKNKANHGFSVKSKVGTTVVPQVSNTRDHRWKNRVSDGCIKMASQPTGDIQRLSRISVKPTVKTTVGIPNTRDHHWKNRVSDGCIKMASQPTGDKQRLSRISVKPTVKTTVGIPKAQRVSRTTSVFSKKTENSSKSESISSKLIAQGVTLDASTSKLAIKGKSGRRKSYISSLIERTKLLNDQVRGTKKEMLPNIYDDGNQFEVAEYVDDIYQHYWVTEAHNQPLKSYMKIQTDITPQMRGILINWLIEVHLKFDLMQETLYLMVTLLDFYLSAVVIKRTEMQLVGLTSLLLASKYEDFWHPRVMELISISAETYTKEQMLAMETTILTTLNYRLNLPTPYVFMLRFLKAAQGDKKFENLAFFLIELCLVEYDALHYKPSLLCASAIYVARCTLHLAPTWTPLLCKHSKYQEFQIRDCAEMILGFHQASRKTVLRVTYDKYTSSKNCQVALIKPLDRLPPA